MKYLKPARVIVSLTFLMLIAASFLDFRNFVPVEITDSVTFLQFVPSMLKLSAGFLIVLAVTLLFGRIYCSSVCPLGTLQDVLSHKKKPEYKLSKPHNKLRFSMLAVSVFTFIAGSSLILNLLDPFSSFGRIFSNLFRPLVIMLNNLTAPLLESKGILFLYRVQRGEPIVFSIVFASAVLGLIVWLSLRHGRLYCNSLCPVGTLLGLVSKVSVFKIAFADHTCTNCGKCAKACKSQCIDIQGKDVDMSRCVSCFNCFSVCNDNALHYKRAAK